MLGKMCPGLDVRLWYCAGIDEGVLVARVSTHPSCKTCTQVKVGSWFGKLDLRVVDMDDHSMVLGLDFIELAQAIPMVDRDILFITAEGKTRMVPMNRRSCLGYRPRMNSMILYPKDPNVKDEDVE